MAKLHQLVRYAPDVRPPEAVEMCITKDVRGEYYRRSVSQDDLGNPDAVRSPRILDLRDDHRTRSLSRGGIQVAFSAPPAKTTARYTITITKCHPLTLSLDRFAKPLRNLLTYRSNTFEWGLLNHRRRATLVSPPANRRRIARAEAGPLSLLV